MKTIFPQRYDMIIELGYLENIMPQYSELLRKFSLVIRNKIWSKSDERRLAVVINSCNKVFTVLVDVLGEHIEILEMYVQYLMKHSQQYSFYDLSDEYNGILAQIQVFKTQELVKEHWKQINPYFRKEYAKEDLLSKDLIAILDDFFDNVVNVCPDIVFLPMRSDKFRTLLRGRRGEWKKKTELEAPSIEVAKEHKIINRWNPPSKRYLYVVAGNGDGNDVETVCEEMRIKSGENYTTAIFEYIEDRDELSILDLDYETSTRQDIFNFAEFYEKKQVNEIITQMCLEEKSFTKEEIIHQIELHHERTTWVANAFVAKLLLKEICDAIFVPLDDDEDNDKDKKEQCYKAFHILAEYLENRGCKGICYPSTRMKLIGKTGRNLVLFNADSAEAVEETFTVHTK